MRSIGICTSSRSERHLMEPIVTEMNGGKYDLKAELVQLLEHADCGWYGDWSGKDFLIIPADRSEMTKFALECFHNNIPFCHVFSGSITYSYTHDDINRFLISLMANFCFAESPEAAENLKRVGIPEDRILVTGTSHFDGITNYDIEANKPKDAPEEQYDMVLFNKETLGMDDYKIPRSKNNTTIFFQPNEDGYTIEMDDHVLRQSRSKESTPHLEFLWFLSHCDTFFSNSSSIHYEVPYLNKFCGANIKVINPSMRNSIRTSIPPEYCCGASKIIAEWCEEVDLEWLRTPKRLWVK